MVHSKVFHCVQLYSLTGCRHYVLEMAVLHTWGRCVERESSSFLAKEASSQGSSKAEGRRSGCGRSRGPKRETTSAGCRSAAEAKQLKLRGIQTLLWQNNYSASFNIGRFTKNKQFRWKNMTSELPLLLSTAHVQSRHYCAFVVTPLSLSVRSSYVDNFLNWQIHVAALVVGRKHKR